MSAVYFCCDEKRRAAVRDHATLNGIDYIEVLKDKSDPSLKRVEQPRIIRVHVLNQNAADLSEENFLIEGGVRRAVQVIEVTGHHDPKGGSLFTILASSSGDFSLYTLRIIRGVDDHKPPPNFDPRLSSIEFSFHLDCEGDVDCQGDAGCEPPAWPAPNIDYLAKDYASLQRLMLDRLSLTLPKMRERNPADLGMVMVELLAYVGDHLSYQQDAIATEAYLNTARRRVSVRRHAKLIDYQIDEGQNARAWLQVALKEGVNFVTLPSKTKVLSLTERGEAPLLLSEEEYQAALRAEPILFETLHEATLYPENNRIAFYTWGDDRCCLLKGATRATLQTSDAQLKPGDVLIFVEERDPHTGNKEDANPAHRHPVRLTRVETTADPLNGAKIVEIEWCLEDALPFSLCLWELGSGQTSVALGNIVLCDHGRSITRESIGRVPNPKIFHSSRPQYCESSTKFALPVRFRPRLREASLTFAAPYEHAQQRTQSAKRSIYPELRPTPQIQLFSSEQIAWYARPDLFLSNKADAHFVVEIESDEVAWLRFGDDENGSRPISGDEFYASYRVGNGTNGNISIGGLTHLYDEALSQIEGQKLLWVTNPIAARGGRDPENIDEAKRRAPRAFAQQERAVTAQDYEDVAKRFPGVQRAAATFRWTGSWYTVFLTVDREGGLPVDASFEKRLRRFLERYRLAGYDLEIDAPRYVPLELSLHICIAPGYLSSNVERQLRGLFSNRTLANNKRGLFHPDLWTFGQTVYLSPLVAAAQATPGVEAVKVLKFGRRGESDTKPIEDGELKLNRIEIAQLESDLNFVERGLLELHLEGGR